MARKDKVVSDLTKGIEFLFKKNKVDYKVGSGSIAAPGKVQVKLNAGAEETLATKAIVIATGSDHVDLPTVPVDEKRIASSTGALSLASVPKHLVVVGGGYIGLEMGSVWRRLGSEVTVVEFLDRITPGMDGAGRQAVPAPPGQAGLQVPARPRLPAPSRARTASP